MTLSFACAAPASASFHAFFADLLRHALHALVEQARGVAGLGLLGGALRDHAFELREERDARGSGCAARRRSR